MEITGDEEQEVVVIMGVLHHEMWEGERNGGGMRESVIGAREKS